MELHQSTRIFPDATPLLACPHCKAGMDRVVLGLFWDHEEASWRCLLCGCRTFDRPRPSRAQVMADQMWDALFPIPEDDGRGEPQGEEEPEEATVPPEAA